MCFHLVSIVGCFPRHCQLHIWKNGDGLFTCFSLFLVQARKSYVEVEKVVEDARAKFTEADTKLRKKDLKFYESMAGLEKGHKKASDRLKSCQKRTTVSRNDYLLSVDSTNAHMKRHSDVDLPQLMLVSYSPPPHPLSV